MVGKQRPMMLSVAFSGSFYQAPQAMQASAAPLSLQLPDPGRILAKKPLALSSRKYPNTS